MSQDAALYKAEKALSLQATTTKQQILKAQILQPQRTEFSQETERKGNEFSDTFDFSLVRSILDF